MCEAYYAKIKEDHYEVLSDTDEVLIEVQKKRTLKRKIKRNKKKAKALEMYMQESESNSNGEEYFVKDSMILPLKRSR